MRANRSGVGRGDVAGCFGRGIVGVEGAAGGLLHGTRLDEAVPPQMIEVPSHGRWGDPQRLGELIYAGAAVLHDVFENAVARALHGSIVGAAGTLYKLF